MKEKRIHLSKQKKVYNKDMKVLASISKVDYKIIGRYTSIFSTCLLLSFALLLSLFGVTTEVQHHQLNKTVEEFKSSSTLAGYLKSANANMYCVKNDNQDITPTFQIKDSQVFVGSPGDILVRTRNILGADYLDDVISYFVGGHSCVIDENQYLIETTGLAENMEDNVVVNVALNQWLYEETILPSYGLKVNTSLENRQQAIQNAKSYIGMPYNYTFFFQHATSLYCTDVPARAYESADASLSFNDYVIEYTNFDILTAPCVSLFYYKEKNPIPKYEREFSARGDYNIYYLYDGNDYDFSSWDALTK